MEVVHDLNGDVVDVPVCFCESKLELGFVVVEGVHEIAALFVHLALELFMLGL